MIKILNKIGRILRSIDLFGIPNSLVLGRSMIYRSKFSGFISLWIILTILALAIYYINKVFSKYGNWTNKGEGKNE